MSESYSIIFVPLSTDGSVLRPPAAILAAVISTSGALVAPVMPSASSNAPTATSAPYDLISLPMTRIWSDSSDLVIEPKWERQQVDERERVLVAGEGVAGPAPVAPDGGSVGAVDLHGELE